nr:uncharacterized protein LOC117612002 [Osmia lignaria]
MSIQEDPEDISEESKTIGQKLYSYFVEINNALECTSEEHREDKDETNISDEELFTYESGQEDDATALSAESSVEESESEEDKNIPFSAKCKVVSLSEQHPAWSLKSLQTKGSKFLKSRMQLTRWRRQVSQGGSRKDKMKRIDTYVYSKFCEARDEKRRMVTSRLLQQWAMEAGRKFLDEDAYKEFNASSRWIHNFKTRHRIRQRKVTKYVSDRDIRIADKVSNAAHSFQVETAAIVQIFNPDHVINTDQTGVEYFISSGCTLSYKGEKQMEVNVHSVQKMTHSYTAQYALILSGKLLPKVFICLQEVSGRFGPQVSQEVARLMEEFGNVVVTCTKSGKLHTDTYKQFLNDVIEPYVQKNPFLYITDSWAGQTNPALYEQFKDENEQPTCTFKVIPPKCTSLCQPCDIYFYRQVKHLIRRIQNHHASEEGSLIV